MIGIPSLESWCSSFGYTSFVVFGANLMFALAALYIGSTDTRAMALDSLNLDFPPLLLHAVLALLAMVYAFYVYRFFLLPRAKVAAQPLPLPTFAQADDARVSIIPSHVKLPKFIMDMYDG